MGSGPSCYLASQYEVSSLILLSPYTSLKDAVASLVGKIPAMLVKQRFHNAEAIKNAKCPMLIIHGQADQLIPYTHSETLKAISGTKCRLITPTHMTHNDFDLNKDLFQPL